MRQSIPVTGNQAGATQQPTRKRMKMADEKTPEAIAREKELDALRELLAEENAKLSGVGLRWKAGMTRGKGSQVVKWQEFFPNTSPATLEEFLSITKTDKPTLLEYAIVGYNDAQYSSASDPIGEFTETTWDKDEVLQFKMVVRNYSKGAGVSIEDAVALIKPGFAAGVKAKSK